MISFHSNILFKRIQLIPENRKAFLEDILLLVATLLFFLIIRILIYYVFKDASSRYFLPVYVPGFILLILFVYGSGQYLEARFRASNRNARHFALRLLVVATIAGAAIYITKTIGIITRGNYGEILQKELSELEIFQKKCLIIDTEEQMSRVLYRKNSPAIIENIRGTEEGLLLYNILNIVKKYQEENNDIIPVYLLLSGKTNDAILEDAQKYWDIVPFEHLKTIQYKDRKGYLYLWKPPVNWKPHPARIQDASNLLASDYSTVRRNKVLWFGDELFCRDFQKVTASVSKDISSNSYWYDLARWGWRRIFKDPAGPWGDESITILDFFQKRFSHNSFSHIIFSFGFHDLYYLDLNVILYTAFSMESFKAMMLEVQKSYPQTQFAVVIPTLVKSQISDDDLAFQAELIGYYRNEMIKTIKDLHDSNNTSIKIIDFDPTEPFSSKLFDSVEERYDVMSKSITDWLLDFPVAE